MGHTPGPWEIYDRETEMGGYRYWVEREEGDGHLIVAEVGKANDARLIAAAPELAALVESVEWTKTSDRWGNWDGYECPWCLCYTDKPENGVHATDCPRQLALGKARGE